MKLLGRQKKLSEKESSKTEVEDTASKTTKEIKTTGSSVVVSYRNIIVRPLVTEKAARLASVGKYVFEVVKDAGRVEVQQSIAQIYGVRPVAVNIQNYRGKRVRFGRRFGQRKAWKKAIVTLPKGEKIDVYEGV